MAQEELYRIELVQEKDDDDVMKLIQRAFYEGEPILNAVGLSSTEEDPCPELEEYCMKTLHEGLSHKAVDKENNIVGIMITENCPLNEKENGDFLFSWARGVNNIKLQKVLYFLGFRERGARLWEQYPHVDSLVELKVAATDPGWRNKGIMKALMKAVESAVLKRNCNELLRINTSSAYSAMAAESLGYTCVYSARYKDVKLDGETLLIPDPPHEKDSVYVKMVYAQKNRECITANNTT